MTEEEDKVQVTPAPARRPFVEPELSPPHDLLETTKQVTSGGATLDGGPGAPDGPGGFDTDGRLDAVGITPDGGADG